MGLPFISWFTVQKPFGTKLCCGDGWPHPLALVTLNWKEWQGPLACAFSAFKFSSGSKGLPFALGKPLKDVGHLGSLNSQKSLPDVWTIQGLFKNHLAVPAVLVWRWFFIVFKLPGTVLLLAKEKAMSRHDLLLNDLSLKESYRIDPTTHSCL